jgi:predicted transcriptional regulator
VIDSGMLWQQKNQFTYFQITEKGNPFGRVVAIYVCTLMYNCKINADCFANAWWPLIDAVLPDFYLLMQQTKNEKFIKNYHNIYQMALKYTKWL